MRRLLLNFHGVGNTSRILDPGEFAYWLPADRFHEIVRLASRPDLRGSIGFTFDDSNESDITTSAPILERYGFRMTCFVLVNRIGRPGSLGAQEIRRLHRAGHEIGSHGMDHQDWTRLDAAELRHEVERSKEILEQIIGAPVRKAGIPFGSYNRRVLKALRRAGYEKVYTSDGGLAREKRWLQPRISLTRAHGMEEIRNMMAFRKSPLGTSLRIVRMGVKRRIKAAI